MCKDSRRDTKPEKQQLLILKVFFYASKTCQMCFTPFQTPLFSRYDLQQDQAYLKHIEVFHSPKESQLQWAMTFKEEQPSYGTNYVERGFSCRLNQCVLQQTFFVQLPYPRGDYSKII